MSHTKEKRLKTVFTAVALMASGCASTPEKTYHPEWAEVHYKAGIAALLERDTKKAIQELEGCLQSDERRIDCRWELGWAFYRESLWKKTYEHWQQVAENDKKSGTKRPELEELLPRVEELVRFQARIMQENQKATETFHPQLLSADQKKLRLRAVGDTMMGSVFPKPGMLPPKDGAGYFSQVKSLLEDADLTFANLEGPLCDLNKKSKKCKEGPTCYLFRTPTRYAKYLADVGVDLASLANNHANDFGDECRTETENAISRFGIKWSGRQDTFASIEKQGLRIGMLAFYTSPHSNYLNDLEAVAKQVTALKIHHDVAIVSFHGGAEGIEALHVPDASEEYHGEDRGHVRQFARTAIDSGADIVIGHGPHVLRGMETYKDRLIAYSLGNFATFGKFNLSSYQGVGMILEVVTDGAGRFIGGKIIPTRQVGKGIPEPDPDRQAIDLVRALSQEDFPESYVRIAKDGTFVAKE